MATKPESPVGLCVYERGGLTSNKDDPDVLPVDHFDFCPHCDIEVPVDQNNMCMYCFNAIVAMDDN